LILQGVVGVSFLGIFEIFPGVYWGIGGIGEFVEVVPTTGVFALDVVGPVAVSVSLVEEGIVSAHVGDPSAFRVAVMEQRTVELHIGVETLGTSSAVECEGHIRKLFPSLHSV